MLLRKFRIPASNSLTSWRGKPQVFHYQLSCEMYIPENVKPKGIIIVSHGYSATMESTFRYVNPLIKTGYAICLFDFGGYGSSRSRDFNELDASVLTEKVDLITVIKDMEKNFHPKRLILMGCSQGGLVSALVANDYPKLIDKMILFYPGFSIPDNMKSGHPILSYDGARIGARYVVDGQKLDPWKQIKNYHGPVLICHGTADYLVNFKYSQTAAKVYSNAKLVPIPHGDHCFYKHGFRQAMHEVDTFLK